MIVNNFCTDCDRDLLALGHSGSCAQIVDEYSAPTVRTSRLSPVGAPKVSTTWKTPRRRASAVVTRKLRKDGRTIDRRFKPVVS